MKHSVTILFVCGLFAWAFWGCKNEVISTDPTHDTTKLWPAYDNTTEKWGYINEKGKMVIPAQYDEVNGFSCGYALVSKDGQYHYINTEGALQYSTNEFNFHDFYYDYVVVAQDGKSGLMNNQFEYVIEPVYSGMGNVSSNGLVVAYKDTMRDKYTKAAWFGYVNTKGEEVIPFTFATAQSFKDGYAIVREDAVESWGAINTSGEYVIPCEHYGLKYLGGDMFAFRKQYVSGCGLLSSKGDILTNPAAKVYYEPAVDNELIGVSNAQEKYGYMDFSRNMKIDYQFDYVMPFYEGYAFVEIEKGDEDIVKVIDTKGKVVYPLPRFSEPETGFHNGLALIVIETEEDFRWRYITPKGETVYEWIEPEPVLPCSPVRRLSERYGHTATIAENAALDTMDGATDRMNRVEEFTAQTKHFSSARHTRRYAHACDPYTD